MQKLFLNKVLQKIAKNISIGGKVVLKIKLASFFWDTVYYTSASARHNKSNRLSDVV